MSKSYLAEAFEELELVDDSKLTGTFDFDKKGAEDLKKFMEDDTFNDFETVIDPEAETEEDLQDSYIGMGILGCDICHSMIYKPVEEIVIDEETHMANVGECCPYCYERDGFKIIGKVAPFEDISVEVEKTEDGEEVPEPTVKVNGKDVPVEEAPEKEEEALTAEQKYPVQSPISENINKKIVSKRRIQESTNSEKLFKAFPDLESDGSETPITTTKPTKPAKQKPTKMRKGSNTYKLFTTFPDLKENKIEEELSNSEKLFRAFPELKMEESMNEAYYACVEVDGEERKFPFDTRDEARNFIKLARENPEEAGFKDKKIGSTWTESLNKKPNRLKEGMKEVLDDSLNLDPAVASRFTKAQLAELTPEEIKILQNPRDKAAINKLIAKYNQKNGLDDSLNIGSNLREGMEDISITTDDQVIKVKATPRADKETIVPVEPKEIEAAQPEAEEPAESGEEELMDIELDEIDETSFDELGESYLKKVYDNVNSFKTVNSSLDANNRLVLEGVIEFKSGKKAKTNFIFEAKEVTRKGKIKFIGENVNLSKNKRAFTLTGSTKNKNLICEQFNYNYLARDEKSGASKRLYGTIRK